MSCNSCNNSLKLGMKWEPLSGNVIQSVRNQIENYKSLETNIVSMVTCTGTSKTVGGVVHLSAQPSGGTAPYKITFTKDSGALGSQIINVAENQLVAHDYTTVSGDISTTAHTFSATTIDSCVGGAKTSTESCSVTVSAATVPAPITSVIVISPTVGTVWEKGKTYNITWTSVGIYPHPKIELYKGGLFNREIVFSSPTIDTYSWTVPTGADLVVGTDYNINIMGCSGTSTGCGSPTTYPSNMSGMFSIIVGTGTTCNNPVCNLIVT